MSNFEDRLLSALKEEITTRKAEHMMTTVTPAPGRSRRRVVGLSAAVAGVAAAATAAVLAGGLLGGPAYAVTRGADGKVSVEINTFTDPEGLEVALGDAGIRAVVDYLPPGQTCEKPRGEPAGDTAGRFAARIGAGKGGKTLTFTIEDGQVGADHTLVLTVSKSKEGDDKAPTALDLSVVKGTVSPCRAVPLPAPTGDGTTKGQDEGPGFDTSTEQPGQGPTLDSKTG
ncbi:unnamed protein product [[Actinomadura] parvosata subsp. kistnae]|uniref:Uncharacterized protein n=1 Tax=[Actinomadura] parvosata subsp. kistnae TaxID=1909395 RepID=A0A1V0AEV7_9ACTN|nr:hypothetical protein [Nonomuraea sp. ATCC 55076]AQZ68735.1 hypothetical protein BKM31_51150 [Nonomuraea sp. ATCC 55076]SPL92771.1 unnamed protein product [Actinomadura parvosata subsp. kistnae]